MFNYTDHLEGGALKKCPVNIFSERARWREERVSYGKDPATNVLKILEENHYYPFGMKHQNYNVDHLDFNHYPGTGVALVPLPAVANVSYNYKYNGKELQEELGLNMYDYGARNYDAALGRWMNVDPLAEKMRRFSPYNYCFNNPLRFTDPDGMAPENRVDPIQRDKDGNIVYVTKGEQITANHPSGSSAVMEKGYVFADDGTPIEVFKNNSMDAGFDTNCHGTTFTDGKYWLNNDQVSSLVKGDGYTEQTVECSEVGDKVVYKEGEDSAHSMTVTKTDGTAEGMMVYGQGGVEIENHTDKATEAWPQATDAKILRKETPDKVVSDEQIKKLAKIIPQG